MRYEISYTLTDGKRVVFGHIREADGKYLASRMNPGEKAFNTFAFALASFELVEALEEKCIAGFEVKRIA